MSPGVDQQPRSAKPFYRLGLTIMELGKSDEAAVNFKRVIEIDPNHTMRTIIWASSL